MRFLHSTLPNELALEMATSVLEQEAKEKPVPRDASGISSDTVRRAVERQITRIQSAPDGEKHRARLLAGTAVGGYVAAGYLSEHEAQHYLISAAMSNTSAPSLAQQDVLDGLRHGMNSPLTIIPQSFADYGIEI
jgi:hypothetical protein